MYVFVEHGVKYIAYTIMQDKYISSLTPWKQRHDFNCIIIKLIILYRIVAWVFNAKLLSPTEPITKNLNWFK